MTRLWTVMLIVGMHNSLTADPLDALKINEFMASNIRCLAARKFTDRHLFGPFFNRKIYQGKKGSLFKISYGANYFM